MKFKKVMRLDRGRKIFRLFRFVWNTGIVGDGNGYSNKLSFSLAPKIFSFNKKFDGWELCLLFVRINRLINYGGRYE